MRFSKYFIIIFLFNILTFVNAYAISQDEIAPAELKVTSNKKIELPEGIFIGNVTHLEKEDCSIEISKHKIIYSDQQKEQYNYSVKTTMGDHLNLTFILTDAHNVVGQDNNSTILTYDNLKKDKSLYQLKLIFNNEDIISYVLRSVDQEKEFVVTCDDLK